jgi:hypothetical protein
MKIKNTLAAATAALALTGAVIGGVTLAHSAGSTSSVVTVVPATDGTAIEAPTVTEPTVAPAPTEEPTKAPAVAEPVVTEAPVTSTPVHHTTKAATTTTDTSTDPAPVVTAEPITTPEVPVVTNPQPSGQEPASYKAPAEDPNRDPNVEGYPCNGHWVKQSDGRWFCEAK